MQKAPFDAGLFLLRGCEIECFGGLCFGVFLGLGASGDCSHSFGVFLKASYLLCLLLMMF